MATPLYVVLLRLFLPLNGFACSPLYDGNWYRVQQESTVTPADDALLSTPLLDRSYLRLVYGFYDNNAVLDLMWKYLVTQTQIILIF